MKLGNLHIEADKDKIYTPDEIIEILEKEPGFFHFAGTMLTNNDDYQYYPVPAYPVINDDGKTFHLEMDKGQENSEFVKIHEEIISQENMPIWEDFNLKFFKQKYRNRFNVSMILKNGKETYVDVFFTDEKNIEIEKIKHHFKNFLEIAKIDTFKKLREKVRRAREIFNETDFITEYDDPFEFYINESVPFSDEDFFEIMKNMF